MILLDTNALYYASKMSCPESINIEALTPGCNDDGIFSCDNLYLLINPR